KEGLAEDPANRDRIAALLRFRTTRSSGDDAGRSLAQYVVDAKPEQKAIYYLVAETPTAARSSPHLEAFREHGVEVLLLTDRIDEWALQHLAEYQGRPLKDVRRGVLDPKEIGAGERLEVPPDKEQNHLLKRVKRALRDRVNEVRASSRLKQSAA